MTTPPRRPSSASRATRRTRRPASGGGSLLQRNRIRIIWIAGLVGFLLLATAFYANASRPSYTCSDIFNPTPAPSWVAPTEAAFKSPRPATPGPATPTPAPPTATPAAPAGSAGPSSSPASTSTAPTTPPTEAPVTAPPPGYVQPDQGNSHVDPGTTVRYPNCPPASGKHYNAQNIGPIRPGFYGLNETVSPTGWVHNLEHGSVILLYSCTAPGEQGGGPCTDAGQQAMRDMFGRWPNSPYCDIPPGSTPGVVITRWDDMPWPYVAIVWDVVLPLQTLDEPAILDFQAQRAERYNPEALCNDPTPTPGPATPTPAVTPASSGAASPTGSPGASPAASAAPAASPAASAPAAT